MRLTDVRLEQIKSYDDKTTVGLGEGVTAILGENGAGKSTVAEAVGWALFDSLPYNQDEFVREGESSGTVWVRFEMNGRAYTVQRGTSGTYSVVDETADAELELGKKEEVVNWLRRTFGLDGEGDVDLSTLWENCIGVPQTQFLSDFRARKGIRKKQFDPLLGIDVYEQAWSTQSTHNLKQPVDELESRKQTAKERISRLEGVVEDLPEQREAVDEQETEVEKLGDELERVQSKLADTKEEFSELDDLKQRRDELDRTIESAESRVEGNLGQLDTARTDLQDARKAAEVVDETADSHRRFREADERLSELREREAERDDFEAELEKAVDSYREAKREYEDLHDRAEAAREADDRMAELEASHERYEELDQKIEEARDAAERIEEIDARITEIDDTNFPEAEAKVSEQRDHISELENKRSFAEEAPELDSMRADMEATIETRQAEIEDLTDQRNRLIAVDFDRDSDGGDHEHEEGETCPTCDRPLDADTRDRIVETIEEQITEAEAEIAAAEARLPAVRAGLDAAKKAQQEVAGLDAARDRLAELEDAVDELEAERESLTDERAELEPIADQFDELCAEQDEIEDDHEAYERAQFEYENKREAIDQIEDAREELYRTAWEAARLERQLASEFGDLNEQIAEQREIKDETEDAHDRYVRNEAEAERVDDRRERVIELYKDIETAERERRAAESELRRVKAKFDADRHAELDDRVDCLDSRETQLDTRLDEARETLDELSSELQRLETVAEQLERWKETHVQLERDIKFAKTVRNGVRDAGPKMRELIASRIGERANQIYQTLRGTGRESLTWDETYQIVVQDGSQHKPFGNLSGGEKMAAALAVRLAIMERVSPLDIAFLDEPTANLDSEKKNNLVRQLERLDAFEQLCVISHDDTFESMTEYTVNLEKPDRESHVVSDTHADAGGSPSPKPGAGDD
ncbi:SMC family ATPase [Halobellus sp. Atlit-38R]|uniref:AAA family ATPase n=1 Tax=Halobellus sp. Atlit-38R TaxID=2282131 RepID=UPI000EF19E72|nr:SMC family ATPase [Halobellus sp. Atlit-38R]RLM83623.1 SMC family ATPase [Halobellus sp. Atlit-38R]